MYKESQLLAGLCVKRNLPHFRIKISFFKNIFLLHLSVANASDKAVGRQQNKLYSNQMKCTDFFLQNEHLE